MSFRSDNTEFERWLGLHCDVVRPDIARKHQRMRENAFVFLRATYFRWARRIETICPTIADAPSVLAVGDMHLENFGTWRDADGRWVWGVNDFDEAATMPYVFDLVRLATSVMLAPKMKIEQRAAAKAILEGYVSGIANPTPALLDEQRIWIRDYVKCSDRCRGEFWEEVRRHRKKNPPQPVKEQLIATLPQGATRFRFCRRVAGGGSLGRPRYVVIADWRHGCVVREAKALVPSAWTWVHGGARTPGFIKLATGRYRAPDPYLHVRKNFVFRRLAADSRKIELGKHAGADIKLDLLRAMGSEIASIHAATDRAAIRIEKDLRMRPRKWLHDAAEAAAAEIEADYKEWYG
jgi:Uncharacterized protein conserved in bacteria (DUF2252)